MRIVRSIALPLAAAAQLLAAGGARAQVGIHIQLGLPERPQLYEVQPGVQVVEGYPDGEVFFSSGWYWCRRPDGWYRSRSPREDFYRVDRDDVPPALQRVPIGEYRDWHHGGERRRDEQLRHERQEEHERHEAEERRERAHHEHEEHEHD